MHFSLCFQLTCKLHWSHLRKALSTLINASSNMLNFSLPHSPIVWKEIFESLLRLQCYKKRGKEMIENISVTSLLAQFLIYSDFPLPASSNHLGFWCLSFCYLTRRELQTLHPESLWIHSSARNPHCIKLQRSCPQGHNVLPTKSLSGQAVLRDRNDHVEVSFWSSSGG